MLKQLLIFKLLSISLGVLILVTEVQATAGAVVYSYDSVGRLKLADYGGGNTIAYAYDNAGNVTQINTVAVDDQDGDSVPDETDNCPMLANTDQKDLDNDKLGDVCDDDRDGDGVANAQDTFPDDANESLDTDKDGIGNNTDTDDDNDGMPDAWETTYGLNPLDAADANTDTDADGLSNLDEFKYGTNPTQADTDTDGASDKAEVDAGRNPVVNEGAVMQILDGMF